MPFDRFEHRLNWLHGLNVSVPQSQLRAEIEVPERLADEAEFKATSQAARTNYTRMAPAREKAPDLVVP